MLRWRLLIGIPLVAAIVLLCWLDAISPIPGLALMPFFLICVYFLCKEALLLLNAGGIYPRRATIYLGVFGTIILCWFSCYNSLPLIADLETAFVAATTETGKTGKAKSNANKPTVAVVETSATESSEFIDNSDNSVENVDAEESAALGRVAQALAAAKRMLKTAESELGSARGENAETGSGADSPDGEETLGEEKLGGIAGADAGDSKRFGVPGARAEEDASLFAFSNEVEWKTAAFACVHILLAIAAGVLIAFVGEMLRFKLPGGHMINLSGAVFAIVYIGLLGSFMVMLRIAYGVAAVVSMIVITKLCDVGAYTVGRLVGRHKMAPSLSPGKTIEGGIGGLAFAVFGAWLSTAVIFPLATGEPSRTTWFGIVLYGVLVGFAGALGDLAESLIKRDVMRKDSGTNVPGFGGFLDIFDSLLLAAPVAFGLWAFHVVR